MLFDTHTHYNLSPLVKDSSSLQKEALALGIKKSVVVGTNIKSSLIALNMREKLPNCFLASLGLHPKCFLEDKVDLNQEVAKWQKLDKSAFDAYGEMGLDFYGLDRQSPQFSELITQQSQLLSLQLQFAVKNPKTVILHVRDNVCSPDREDNAYGLIIKILTELKASNLNLIFHCFSGNRAYLEKVLLFPHSYISFAGNLTFKSALNMRELADLVPSSRRLLETDAPFLAPEGRRGQVCKPSFLDITAKFAEKNLGFNLEEIYQNSLKAFSLLN